MFLYFWGFNGLTDQFENLKQLQPQCLMKININFQEIAICVIFKLIISIEFSSSFLLSLPRTPTMHLCGSGVYFRCILFHGRAGLKKPNFESCSHLQRYLLSPQVWKCIESTNQCCPPVQHLRFMHFRNLLYRLFECRNYWLDCLTFRTFLSSCAVKIFQNPKTQRFLHFRNLHHRFSQLRKIQQKSPSLISQKDL